jgi:hypothetical protein
VIRRLAGKSPGPTDAKRSLRARQAPGDGSPSAHQPVACHPPVERSRCRAVIVGFAGEREQSHSAPA